MRGMISHDDSRGVVTKGNAVGVEVTDRVSLKFWTIYVSLHFSGRQGLMSSNEVVSTTPNVFFDEFFTANGKGRFPV